MKTKLFSIVMIFTTIVSYAQQDAQYTQYMYNTISVNPAYAGSRGALSVFALHRTQWVGLDGAPITNTVSVNTPFNNSKLGLGVSIVNDEIGPSTNNSISADISYYVPVSESYRLSFGIKGTANIFNIDVSKLNPGDQTDPEFQNIDNEFSPNIGAGLYLHSQNGYLGFSIPNFIETNAYNDNDIAVYKEKINYYLIGGYVFDLSSSIKFKPTFMTKMTNGAPLQLDVSGNFMFNEKFTVGLAYRWSASLSAMVGFQITEGLYLGYGYDFETTKLANYNSGSHEIFLRYEIFKKNSKMVTPRFF
ncbi:type IX secretion system membrane protein PorP/SprF [Flavobacterium sp. ZT3R18]|uniref:PorP/SprF family type IX secretion system membrane protein n=1 Tax=Flavobacterium sp. ZT3R18 TaxID=2594429 RepID=UPI00117BC7DB|nr:type IX secretion system membrane protein PorP/SprF [Flavobacterium sp. ZT3R18]TRX30271.1 type IX secretion system membrane protein PorP/SprF [Flavobacterium sp. ZT3R18]